MEKCKPFCTYSNMAPHPRRCYTCGNVQSFNSTDKALDIINKALEEQPPAKGDALAAFERLTRWVMSSCGTSYEDMFDLPLGGSVTDHETIHQALTQKPDSNGVDVEQIKHEVFNHESIKLDAQPKEVVGKVIDYLHLRGYLNSVCTHERIYGED